MAIFRPGSIVGDVSGKLGGTVFAKGRFGPVVRKRSARSGGRTEAALAARGRLAGVARSWATQSAETRASWDTVAGQVQFVNRLGLARNVTGFNLYCMVGLGVLDGVVPSGQLPPAQLLQVMPSYYNAYFLEGGPYAVTAWGSPFPVVDLEEVGYLQRGRGQTQRSGWSRFQRAYLLEREYATQDVYASVESVQPGLLDGELFAAGGAWRFAAGLPGVPFWVPGTVGSVPWEVDYFERSQLGPYTGGTSYFSIDTSVVHDGAASLKCTLPAGGAVTAGIVSTAGLPLYPLAGHTFECWVRVDGAADRAELWWGYNDVSNRYLWRWGTSISCQFLKVVGGSATVLFVCTGGVMSSGSWYRVVVSWASDGTFTARLYNAAGVQIGTGTGASTDFVGGGVGFQGRNVAASAADVYWDAFAVTGAA